jgi:hypothetical protein
MNSLMASALHNVFENLGVKAGTLVDIGAWDGVYESNTRLFVVNKWESYLIEANKERFKDLLANSSQFKNAHCFNTFVSENTNFDQLFGWNKLKDLDLLQIDIDGRESFIIKLFLKYHPKIICTEFNPIIPLDISVVDINKEGFGSSLTGIANMLRGNYVLIGVIGADAVFVRKDLEGIGRVPHSGYFPKFVFGSRYFFAYSGQLVKTDSEISLDQIIEFLNYEMKFSEKIESDFNVPWHLVKARQPLLFIFRSWPQKQIEKFVFKYGLGFYYKIISKIGKK